MISRQNPSAKTRFRRGAVGQYFQAVLYASTRYNFVWVVSSLLNFIIRIYVCSFTNLHSVHLLIYACSNSVQRKRPAVSPVQTVKLNAKKPWPATLVLPTNFTPDVTRLLGSREGQKLMVKKQRNSFIRSLCDHFSLFTL